MLKQTRKLEKPAATTHREGEPKSRLSRGVARLMDDFITIPGTQFKIGLDPIIGLIPGMGDSIGAAAGSVILLAGLREGLPTVSLARMGVNIVINSAIGAIPVLGDIFSAWFKSNRRNYRILQAHTGVKKKASGLDYVVVALFAVLLLVILAGAIWLSVLLIEAMLKLLA